MTQISDFLYWWQHLPSQMNPVIFSLGPLVIRWYGAMYIIAFAVVYALLRYRASQNELTISVADIGDILTWAMAGVVLGGRIGYLLFYGFAAFIADPLGSLIPGLTSSPGGMRFSGISGMSFHGGLLGVVLALLFYARNRKKGFFETIEYFIPAIPLGYTFGRLGNFINGELYGRVTTAGIGMYFPDAPTIALRHPSQLYEAFFEGIILFLIFWLIRKKPFQPGTLSALYLFAYGFVRFFIEFFREPDAHLGFVFFSFSMGQVLCFLMMFAGCILYLLSNKIWESGK